MNALSTTTDFPDIQDKLRNTTQCVYAIAPDRSTPEALAKRAGIDPKIFIWVRNPKDLQGLRNPIVFIFPNWWKHDYAGMEEMLQEVEADIYPIYYGRKPNYKNQPLLPR